MGSLFFLTSASRRREKLPCVYIQHARVRVHKAAANFLLFRQTFPFFDTNTDSGMGGRLKCIPGAPLFPFRPWPSSRRVHHHHYHYNHHAPPLLSSPLAAPQPIFTPLLQPGSTLDRLTYWKKFRNVLSLTEGLPKVSKNFLEARRYSCRPRVCRAEWSGEEALLSWPLLTVLYKMKHEWKCPKKVLYDMKWMFVYRYARINTEKCYVFQY